MDDLISRQDAIGEAEEWIETYSHGRGGQRERDAIKHVISGIKKLPSAQSERKKGKWIPHSEKSREYIGTVLVNVEYDYWFCDTCGYQVENGQPMYNFRPNCGADMKG